MRDANNNLTKDCFLIHNSIQFNTLELPVKSMIVARRKTAPLFNTTHISHWSIICETDKGFYEISCSRYMSIYLTPVIRKSHGIFEEQRMKYILKYITTYYSKQPIRLKDILLVSMAIHVCRDCPFNLCTNNCQHFVIDTIKTLCKYSEDDPILTMYRGKDLINMCISEIMDCVVD